MNKRPRHDYRISPQGLRDKAEKLGIRLAPEPEESEPDAEPADTAHPASLWHYRQHGCRHPECVAVFQTAKRRERARRKKRMGTWS